MKVFKLFIVLLILTSCASQKNVVADESDAIKIAEQKLLSSIDKDELESLQPFMAILRDDKIWEVFPRDIAEFGGLPPIVYVKRKNGKVINVRREGIIPSEALTGYFNKDIVGIWTMCQNGYEIGDEKHVISRNICTEISFYANGKGFVRFPGDELNFSWLEIEGLIKFSFASEGDKKRFISSNTDFTFTISKNEKGKQLKLMHELSNSWYLLMRPN